MEDGVACQISTFAFGTRLLLILFQFLANVLIPDHDAKVFNPPIDRTSFSTLDYFIELFLGGFRRWDAVYFSHISQYGYTFENCTAFFPLFPLIVTLFARCVSFFGVLHLSTSVLVSAVIINCVFFTYTAKYLYILGLKIGLEKKVSFLSSILFCVNPASIFMTAPYSETLYMLLVVLFLLLLQEDKIYYASVFIGLSVLTRSNGLVGIGFVVHSIVLSFSIFLRKRVCSQRNQSQWLLLIINLIKTFSKIVITVFICVLPFFLYQYYIFVQFCQLGVNKDGVVPEHIMSYGRSMNYKVLGDAPPPWCYNTIPLSYSYIQSHYWDVGFLSYYEFKQIPNFLLAFPVILCSYRCCVHFFNLKPGLFYGLGMVDLSKLRHKHDSDYYVQEKVKSRKETSYLASKVTVFIFHLAFLVVFGCCFVHIQVLTRMLFSSSPLIYWYCGFILGKDACISKYADDQLQEMEGLHVNFKAQHLATEKTVPDDVIQSDHNNRIRSLYPLPNKFIRGRRKLHVKRCSEFVPMQLLFCVYRNWTSLSGCSRLIILYFGAYFVLGTVMFCNFLPWT